jgi:hypothetical protein
LVSGQKAIAKRALSSSAGPKRKCSTPIQASNARLYAASTGPASIGPAPEQAAAASASSACVASTSRSNPGRIA